MSEDLLAQLEGIISRMSPEKKAELRRIAEPKLRQAWLPNPGRQAQAYVSNADMLLYGGGAGGGKALDLDTLLPTPDGWTTMRDVSVGDMLLGADGRPTRVVATSPVLIGRTCHRVVFSDGSEIVADADHRWVTTTADERIRQLKSTSEWREARKAKRPSRGTGKRPDLAIRNSRTAALKIPVAQGAVRTTAEIAATLYDGHHANHSVEVCRAIDLPRADLPIDPYILGAWLGDGSSYKAEITTMDAEILAAFHSAGYETTPRTVAITHGVYGLLPQLRSLEVLANKHIPRPYLRASAEQRLALLQGLMDTDGYAAPNGKCEFVSVNRRLAFEAHELICSLGIKAMVTVGRAMLRGKDCGEKYRIIFTARQPVFRLSRKLSRQMTGKRRDTIGRRYIVSADQVPSVPVKCVAVDAADHLYLAGPTFIPTHNTDLLLGLALTTQRRSVIFRRAYVDLRGAEDRLIEIVKSREGYNGQDMVYKSKGRVLEFGALEKPGAEFTWQGRPHDFIGFDEGAQLSGEKVSYVCGWLRSTDPKVRKRVVIATNPPMGGEGEWLIEWFAPWLNPEFARPAAAGEIRWCVTIDQKVQWVDGPGSTLHNGERYTHESRTFIPALLGDNPYLKDTGYRARIENMPEPLRSQLLYGDFLAGREDHEWQVIPTAWVKAAQARWRAAPSRPRTMIALAMDVAMGGGDDTTIAMLHEDAWFGPIVKRKGVSMADPSEHAALLVQLRRDEADISVDATGGWGTGVCSHLKHQHGIEAGGLVFSKKSAHKAKDGKLGFRNLRAEMYWRLREALNPDSKEGICLPPDPRLLAQLTTIRYTVRGTDILMEDKDEIRKRTGGSTDEADAVVMAWHRRAASLKRARTEVAGLPKVEEWKPPLVVPGRNDAWMMS